MATQYTVVWRHQCPVRFRSGGEILDSKRALSRKKLTGKIKGGGNEKKHAFSVLLENLDSKKAGGKLEKRFPLDFLTRQAPGEARTIKKSCGRVDQWCYPKRNSNLNHRLVDLDRSA